MTDITISKGKLLKMHRRLTQAQGPSPHVYVYGRHGSLRMRVCVSQKLPKVGILSLRKGLEGLRAYAPWVKVTRNPSNPFLRHKVQQASKRTFIRAAPVQ